MVVLLAVTTSRASEIKVFGIPPGATIQGAVYGDTVSVHAENVPLSWLLGGLQRQLDGPTFSIRDDASAPVSVAVHRITWSKLLHRILRNYNAVYFIRDGRIEHVRVLSKVDNRPAITAVVHETAAEWAQTEEAMPP